MESSSYKNANGFESPAADSAENTMNVARPDGKPRSASAKARPADVGCAKKRADRRFKSWRIQVTGHPKHSFRGPYISADILIPQDEGGGRYHCLIGSRGANAEEVVAMTLGEYRTIEANVEVQDYFDKSGYPITTVWLCLD